MTPQKTHYVNTDFDLESATAFDTLAAELSSLCCQLHYEKTSNGTWSASYEADPKETDPKGDCPTRDAAKDIADILEAIASLSPTAKTQLAQCSQRDFNIGFHCWDTWAYQHQLPSEIITAISRAHCSTSITLYPMRKPDGTPID